MIIVKFILLVSEEKPTDDINSPVGTAEKKLNINFR